MGDSGWTIDTLRQHLEARLAELDRIVGQRFEASAEAVKLAYEEIRRWQQAANEWRGAMSDLRERFPQAATVDARFQALEDKIATLAKAVDRAEGHRRGVGDGWGWLVGAVGLVGAVIAVLFHH